jgi:uncharacterized protein (DUF934 family)
MDSNWTVTPRLSRAVNQAPLLVCRQHLAPIEARAGHRVHGALGVALRPRRSADRVRGFLHQQRLVAVQCVERAQTLCEVLRQLGGS